MTPISHQKAFRGALRIGPLCGDLRPAVLRNAFLWY